ncbi:tripartite tricarboxylate transporter TctB family protein [Pelagibacterium halotolerans]|uniref:Tricarboxylate transport protein TctB n=1 Tax=Pelagibacterium halotolerans (strain DSM 22347 / JCM 15775 / CGMCC 1.7692 / B2) TaxID=1082931 RepID=G4R792_PELHB|nr:tripartite tricarboxylate transporter TctB family protein [Pelagibacterium halotolerans]AEQ51228.1 tricarboxylate transport protein TctB [Pelagibacterium halotolerans B2]QJR18909.1 tripartite tricarboxylate transporter TctB family protein [Pelagibacterium halotolerans]SEA67826.1 putative tricarboxylic transport membrane protein [Pelagibacterium halotolerans]
MTESETELAKPIVSYVSMPGAFVFSLLVLAVSLVLFQQAWTIAGIQSLSSAGVFPMLAAGTMAVSGLFIAVKSFRERRAARKKDGAGSLGEVVTLPIAIFAAMIVAYLFVLQPLGFIVSSYLFLLAGTGFLYRKRFVMLALINAIVVAVVYVVFRYVFVVVLPRGVFF